MGWARGALGEQVRGARLWGPGSGGPSWALGVLSSGSAILWGARKRGLGSKDAGL